MTDLPGLPVVGTRRALRSRDSAASTWPAWAIPQLEAAAAVAERVAVAPNRSAVATELYREWFNPEIVPPTNEPRRSLAGLYRAAHAGSRARFAVDDVWVLDRHDVVGRDGWWRTWNDSWVPTRSRVGATRVLFSPIPTTDGLADFVGTLTTRLRAERAPWLLACATDVRRLRRMSSAVLYLPDGTVPSGLIDAVEPLLLPDTPPLCLQLGPGVALAEYPSNGMSFGEHRCHLVARALRTSAARRDPLRAIASTFSANGLDPTAPYLSSRADRRAA